MSSSRWLFRCAIVKISLCRGHEGPEIASNPTNFVQRIIIYLRYLKPAHLRMTKDRRGKPSISGLTVDSELSLSCYDIFSCLRSPIGSIGTARHAPRFTSIHTSLNQPQVHGRVGAVEKDKLANHEAVAVASSPRQSQIFVVGQNVMMVCGGQLESKVLTNDAKTKGLEVFECHWGQNQVIRFAAFFPLTR